VVQGTG